MNLFQVINQMFCGGHRWTGAHNIPTQKWTAPPPKQKLWRTYGANGAISKMNLLSNVRMQNDVVDDKDTLEHRLSFTYPMFWRHFVDVDIDIKNDTILHLPEEEQRTIIHVHIRDED